jgi:hypothetical protein
MQLADAEQAATALGIAVKPINVVLSVNCRTLWQRWSMTAWTGSELSRRTVTQQSPAHRRFRG